MSKSTPSLLLIHQKISFSFHKDKRKEKKKKDMALIFVKEMPLWNLQGIVNVTGPLIFLHVTDLHHHLLLPLPFLLGFAK